MTELGRVEEAFTNNPNYQTLGDYYVEVIRQYREAQINNWYHTQQSLGNDLARIGFTADRMGIALSNIAKERGLISV